MVGRLFAATPFVILVLLYLAAFRWRGRTRIAALAVAIVAATLWFPTRHLYFLAEWTADRQSPKVGTAVFRCLGYWSRRDEDQLRDIAFLEWNLSRVLRDHDDPYIRFRSAVLLGRRSRLDDPSALVRALDDPDFYVRLASALGIWRHHATGITYTRVTHLETESSLAAYMGVAELPSVPYGDDHKDVWQTFVDQVKRDFAGRVASEGRQ